MHKKRTRSRPTSNITEAGQSNVNEEITSASSLEKDTKTRKDNGNDELEDIGEELRFNAFHYANENNLTI
ncbi:hypothetical protein BGZ49_003571 [Haplosporangium sp. Z 27]|nr:hypothetical protein BGZ49_003571 [Haplosporangium sp. Z 27]